MFRTQLNPVPYEFKITYQSSVLTMGSCFADSMGKRMVDNKFNVFPNPFGIIYNPVSIIKLIHFAIDETYPDDDTYIKSQGVYYNYDLHSEFSALTVEELKLKVEGAIISTHKFLQEADWIFLTFGTAIGYILKENNQLVANCHKVPAKQFEKHFLTQKQIISSFENLFQQLTAFNPGLRIILTVSPVRHLRETLELNSVSKSILRITCHTLQEEYEAVSYFPAYEILLDDLRDYRFYASDMLHPNETAEDYIWDKFMSAYFDEFTCDTLSEWVKVKRALDHRPFHKQSGKYGQFLSSTLNKLNKLGEGIDVSNEITQLQKILTTYSNEKKT